MSSSEDNGGWCACLWDVHRGDNRLDFFKLNGAHIALVIEQVELRTNVIFRKVAADRWKQVQRIVWIAEGDLGFEPPRISVPRIDGNDINAGETTVIQRCCLLALRRRMAPSRCVARCIACERFQFPAPVAI